MANLLREQLRKVRGKAATEEFLPVAALGLRPGTSEEEKLLWKLFHGPVRANALAYMEKRGLITSADVERYAAKTERQTPW